jgi:hypothetical protein
MLLSRANTYIGDTWGRIAILLAREGVLNQLIKNAPIAPFYYTTIPGECGKALSILTPVIAFMPLTPLVVAPASPSGLTRQLLIPLPYQR